MRFNYYEYFVDLRKINRFKLNLMKLFLTIGLAMGLCFALKAQSPDKALARVRYTFTHIQDTTQKDKPRTENMLLVIGKNASIYTSYDKLNQTLNMQKQIQEQIKNSAGGPQNIKIESRSTKPITQIDYFYFAKENKLITKERILSNYLIEETALKIDWKILKDTMSFSGVKCQKAIANFKGRNWIAWFANDLPFESGPWKLHGLPGLIIEAYDDRKEVQFTFAGLENVKTETDAISDPKIMTGGATIKIVGIDTGSDYQGSEIKLPTDAIKTTQKELDKLKAARDKDPEGFMQAQMAAQGIQGTFKRSATPGGPPRPINVINNPIELPEKK